MVIPENLPQPKNQPNSDSGSFNSTFSNSNLLLLILSNIIVLALALLQNWSIMSILWLYWIQSVIIGVTTFIKIVLYKNPNETQPLSGMLRIPLAAFFAFHYGMFHFVYFIFLTVFNVFGVIAAPVNLYEILTGSIIFIIYHIYSFTKDYLFNKQGFEKYREAAQIMTEPYFRIIPMHITIILGGVLYSMTNGSQILLAFFLILKLLSDIWAFKKEKSGLPIMEFGPKAQ